jgi:hypothetical protein
MREGTTATMPYSKEALKSLSELLQIHGSMVWLDPTTNSISHKTLDFADRQATTTANSNEGGGS